MGIPYSKQIHAAFDQVTPLVAAGFEVLQTTKNISILLFALQVLTVLLLAFILLALLALLITVNPDLDAERTAVVTPALRWIANRRPIHLVWLFALLFAPATVLWFQLTYVKRPEDRVIEDGEMEQKIAGEDEDQDEDEDDDAGKNADGEADDSGPGTGVNGDQSRGKDSESSTTKDGQ